MQLRVYLLPWRFLSFSLALLDWRAVRTWLVFDCLIVQLCGRFAVLHFRMSNAGVAPQVRC